MEEGLINVSPDKEKAKSILRMVDKTLQLIDTIDIDIFPAHVTKEYYDAIRELISIILLLDGLKSYGDRAHKRQIEYIRDHYDEISAHDISIIDDLRVVRNRIAYDGFFVEESYIRPKISNLKKIISKLNTIISEKIKQ